MVWIRKLWTDGTFICPRGSWKMPTCEIMTTAFLGLKMVLRCAWETPLNLPWDLCIDTSPLCSVALCVLRGRCQVDELFQRLEWEVRTFWDNYMTLLVATVIYWFSDRDIWYHFSVFSTPQTLILCDNSLHGSVEMSCGRGCWLESERGLDPEKRAMITIETKQRRKAKSYQKGK